MTIWNDCELIISPKSNKIQTFSKNIQKLIDNFVAKIGHWPIDNVWYDTKKDLVFGLDLNWGNSTSRESSVIEEKEKFLNSRRGISYVDAYFYPLFTERRIENSEIICSDHPKLNKFKDSKILLVGAGPSTKEMNWNPNDYDYVWSCNHFFINERLKEIDIAVAKIGDEVDTSLKNKKFHEYMKSHETLICFEDRSSINNSVENMIALKRQYFGRCFYTHTRYRAKIGTLPRLLCIAILLGAKEISFVGMDGIKRDAKNGELANHSFEIGKTNTGTCDYDLYRRHYVMLWDYILNTLDPQRIIKLQNLGEGNECNLTTDISRQKFPLDEK